MHPQRDYSSVAIKSEDDSSDSDDDDPDDPDSPSALARLKREFHLGKFCARRTRVFHELTHWEVSRSCWHEWSDSELTIRIVGFVRDGPARGRRPATREA